MKKSPWILSGLCLLFVWPFAGMMTAFAYDAPSASPDFEIVRPLLAFTFGAVPVVWSVALVLSIVEARRKKREKLLHCYSMSPFVAGGIHLFVWVFALAGMHQ